MVEAIGKGYVVQHCISLYRKRQEMLQFRSYIADAIMTLNNAFVRQFGGNEITTRYIDLVQPERLQENDRDADEIAADIILRAGLSFGGKKQEEPQNG